MGCIDRHGVPWHGYASCQTAAARSAAATQENANAKNDGPAPQAYPSQATQVRECTEAHRQGRQARAARLGETVGIAAGASRIKKVAIISHGNNFASMRDATTAGEDVDDNSREFSDRHFGRRFSISSMILFIGP